MHIPSARGASSISFPVIVLWDGIKESASWIAVYSTGSLDLQGSAIAKPYLHVDTICGFTGFWLDESQGYGFVQPAPMQVGRGQCTVEVPDRMIADRADHATSMPPSDVSGTTDSHPANKALSDLEKLSRDHCSGPMGNLDEFAKYWNDFDNIARGLVDAKAISRAERDFLFWSGLPHATRKALGRHMASVDLAYNERLIPTWREAIQAGRHVFRDPSTMPKQEKDIDKLVRALHGLSVDDSNYAVAYARLLLAAPNVADRIPPPSRWTRSHTNEDSSSVIQPPPRTPVGHPNDTARCRPTLRRVQSFVSWQYCPSCVSQQSAHQHHHTS
ncbi:hypothetical protein NP233_g1772 [Leucocoprinus birnbaumii]|uniref:Uncharacterized protein n=1 Tax=Leucocoprinus birnbaumii TaxID=56174 RepID=A0AAD5W5A6_9AGAR|nr:hypothetical protein NP233_g1772 [Leucocoprinus birnbaumii]